MTFRPLILFGIAIVSLGANSAMGQSLAIDKVADRGFDRTLTISGASLVPGERYLLERSEDLKHWSTAGLMDSTSPVSSDQGAGRHAYYRLDRALAVPPLSATIHIANSSQNRASFRLADDREVMAESRISPSSGQPYLYRLSQTSREGMLALELNDKGFPIQMVTPKGDVLGFQLNGENLEVSLSTPGSDGTAILTKPASPATRARFSAAQTRMTVSPSLAPKIVIHFKCQGALTDAPGSIRIKASNGPGGTIHEIPAFRTDVGVYEAVPPLLTTASQLNQYQSTITQLTQLIGNTASGVCQLLNDALSLGPFYGQANLVPPAPGISGKLSQIQWICTLFQFDWDLINDHLLEPWLNDIVTNPSWFIQADARDGATIIAQSYPTWVQASAASPPVIELTNDTVCPLRALPFAIYNTPTVVPSLGAVANRVRALSRSGEAANGAMSFSTKLVASAEHWVLDHDYRIELSTSLVPRDPVGDACGSVDQLADADFLILYRVNRNIRVRAETVLTGKSAGYGPLNCCAFGFGDPGVAIALARVLPVGRPTLDVDERLDDSVAPIFTSFGEWRRSAFLFESDLDAGSMIFLQLNTNHSAAYCIVASPTDNLAAITEAGVQVRLHYEYR